MTHRSQSRRSARAWAAAALLLAASPGWAQSRFNKLSAMLAEGLADQGFWKVGPGPAKGARLPDGGTMTAKERFLARLSPVDLEASSCEALFPRGTTGLTLTVHGIGGAGEEWEAAVAPLAAGNNPVYMYRYFPSGSREGMARTLADGVNRLQECLANNRLRLLVVGHSAGGVLAATAASQLKPDAPDIARRIAIVTVAAPLGGMGLKQGKPPRGWLAFIEELGSDLRDYLPAPPGVRVLHLRTHPRTDIYAVNSSPVGHDAGWAAPGVPGARAVDLDPAIDHSAAVAWAARELQRDAFRLWHGDPPVAPAAPAPAPTGTAPKE